MSMFGSAALALSVAVLEIVDRDRKPGLCVVICALLKKVELRDFWGAAAVQISACQRSKGTPRLEIQPF